MDFRKFITVEELDLLLSQEPIVNQDDVEVAEANSIPTFLPRSMRNRKKKGFWARTVAPSKNNRDSVDFTN